MNSSITEINEKLILNVKKAKLKESNILTFLNYKK